MILQTTYHTTALLILLHFHAPYVTLMFTLFLYTSYSCSRLSPDAQFCEDEDEHIKRFFVNINGP